MDSSLYLPLPIKFVMWFFIFPIIQTVWCVILTSYIISFQEIVPLNAGNVLVIEDNEPAARWLSLINQSLNNPINGCSRGPKPATGFSGSKFFPKPSLKSISKTFRTVSRRKLKSCNCTPLELERKRSKDFWFRCQPSHVSENGISSEEDEEEDPSVFDISEISIPESGNEMKYGLIASKQMVGIFVTIWMRKELVPYVSHLRIASTSRGIMGCLGNKVILNISSSLVYKYGIILLSICEISQHSSKHSS